MNKARLDEIATIQDLAQVVRRHIQKVTLGYLESGAIGKAVLRRNHEALDPITLVPQYIRNVWSRAATTSVFGQTYDLPIEFANATWRGAEQMLAAAASNANVPYSLSTVGTTSIERIATNASGNVWFQLYVAQDHNVTFDLLRRANAAGVQVLLITVDVPIQSKSVQDIRNGFKLPLRPKLANIVDVLRRPTWLLGSAVAGLSRFESLVKYGLPSASAFGDRLTVMLDSGIRSGEDVLRRLSSGGEFVFFGRSFAYGAAAAGTAAVAETLSRFNDDILRALARLGINNLTGLRSRGATKPEKPNCGDKPRECCVRRPAIADFRLPITT
jgi:isopentenyl diphosphate isomerase/L-lactate dehydrogenase-like FMN-dependent dehydrogenase